MIIAVDFDGTIVAHRYPKIGKELPFATLTLKKLQERGHRLILWTYREGKLLEEAVQFCQSKGVEFYAVNKSYPEEKFDQNTPRKIHADLFIDDRNAGVVFELSLSTPWDVTTATLTFTLDISDQQKEVRGIEFVKDGKIMMLMDTGRNEVLQYNLLNPWDIATAVFFDTYDVSTLTSQGRGLSFNANENIMYITGRDEKKVFQLEFFTP